MLYLFGNFYIKAYLLPQKKFKLENGHDGLDQHRKIRQWVDINAVNVRIKASSVIDSGCFSRKMGLEYNDIYMC